MNWMGLLKNITFFLWLGPSQQVVYSIPFQVHSYTRSTEVPVKQHEAEVCGVKASGGVKKRGGSTNRTAIILKATIPVALPSLQKHADMTYLIKRAQLEHSCVPEV